MEKIKCVHGHSPEEIIAFGCETNPEYQGVTVEVAEGEEVKVEI